MLGQNLPQTFKTIDKIDRRTGVVTSIKSLDLGAKTYQETSVLKRVLGKYVDKMAKYNGGELSGINVDFKEITGRALDLAVPSLGNGAQQSVLRWAVEYGAERGVNVNIIIFK